MYTEHFKYYEIVKFCRECCWHFVLAAADLISFDASLNLFFVGYSLPASLDFKVYTVLFVPVWELISGVSQQSPKFQAQGTGFIEDDFSTGSGGDGLVMLQVHYIYCAFYFYNYYISFTSDHQALDPGGWGPLM